MLIFNTAFATAEEAVNLMDEVGEIDDEVEVDTDGEAALAARYQFSAGSPRHWPTVTVLKP